MDTNLLDDIPVLRVSLIPKPITYTTSRTHPIFFWHKTHIRSVQCKLIIDFSGVLKVQYFDKKNGIFFVDKQSAEQYLGKKIPENKYENKKYIETMRNVYSYYICQKCNSLEYSYIKIVFLGTPELTFNSINTTIDSTCPKCHKTTVQIDLSTEPSPASNLKQDCDLAR